MYRLLFLGDVFLPFDCLSNLNIDIDLGKFVFNLEAPITSSGNGYPNKVNLKCEYNNIFSVFPEKPFAVCLGNNHIIDYGEKGFKDTIRVLEGGGIRYFGAGYLEDNCNNPLIVEVQNLKLGLMAYVCKSTTPVFVQDQYPGVMPNDYSIISRDIRVAREMGASRIIVFMHWGAEEVYLPKLEDILKARQIIDSGADLIIGHHSHCIQPFEVYKGKYIFYGLGNCIMPDLNVPSYFNQNGEPTRRYIKKQQEWNKKSLAVSYNPNDESIEVFQMYFNGSKLSVLPFDINKHFLVMDSLGGYKKRFKKSFVFGKMRAGFSSFICYPKIPQLRHFKWIFRLLKERDFK